LQFEQLKKESGEIISLETGMQLAVVGHPFGGDLANGSGKVTVDLVEGGKVAWKLVSPVTAPPASLRALSAVDRRAALRIQPPTTAVGHTDH
jgi:hypothetical protein